MPKAKIVPVGQKNIQWQIMCPGCGEVHALSPLVHTFNGNLDKPTFSPSLLQDFDPLRVCHSYVFEGHIRYLSDCFHDLKNKTVELPEIP